MNSKNIQKTQIIANENMQKKTYNKNAILVKKSLLAVDITNDKKSNILEFIVESIENSGANYYITTPNPEMVVYALAHPDFREIVNKAKIALCDGIGLLWASRMLGIDLKERFAGVEAMERLCEIVANRPITVGFFGGREGVAKKTAECLVKRYPNLKVAFSSDTWSQDYLDKQEVVSSKYYVISKNNDRKQNIHTTRHRLHATAIIDILFVALGFPKQEEWMASHLNKIPVRVMIGVGGAFDYVSGKVGRAPKWVQNIGMEWLYRLFKEPWRIRRQLALPVFVWMVVKEKLASLSSRA